MKTLSTLFFLPALMTGSLVVVQMVSENYFWPAIHFWPRASERNRTKVATILDESKPERVAELNYHSLMVNAASYYTTKNYAAALVNYRQVLATQPDDIAALSGEAWSLYYLGLEEQAAKDFQTLLKFNANDSWAREGMALCNHGDVSKPILGCS